MLGSLARAEPNDAGPNLKPSLRTISLRLPVSMIEDLKGSKGNASARNRRGPPGYHRLR